jgi:RHS repeat-associated protein
MPSHSPRATRYQFSNHLGSAALELDESAQIVSYEEYTPYGSTSYQAVRSVTETPKRYRYTGKERDEETGLYYHGARYYAPWLGRWTATDPKGIDANIDLYTYAIDNPVRLFDPSGQDWRDSLSWTQRAALWVDEEVIQTSPVAKGVVKNLEKRGEAFLNAPKAIAETYEKGGRGLRGVAAIGKGMLEGAANLVTDTVHAAEDVGYYGAKAYYEGDPQAKEIVASRALDIVLNIADIGTLIDGAGAVKNAAVGGGKALASTAKSAATTVKEGMEVLSGARLAPAVGVIGSGGRTLVATGKGAKALSDASRATILMMAESKNIPGAGGAESAGPKWSPAGRKHTVDARVPWKDVVKSTKSGAAKYRPGFSVEELEKRVWAEGQPVSTGRSSKVMEFAEEIGASEGKPSRWVRVDESAGTIHGHPITEADFRKLTR